MASQMNFELPLSVERLVALLHGLTGEKIIVINSNFELISADKQFLQMVGWEQEDWQGRSIHEVVRFCDQTDMDGMSEDGQGIHLLDEMGAYSLRKASMQFIHDLTDQSKLPCVRFSFNVEDYSDPDSVEIIMIGELHTAGKMNLLQRFAGSFMKDVNLGVLLIDMDFKLVEISEAACKILGFEREKILNQPLEKLFASVPQPHTIVQRTLLDGVVVRNHAVSWMNNSDRFELLMDSGLLNDQYENAVGAYIIFKDVSNLRSLGEQVQRSDRLAMIGQIAAGTAHEIRNPLTSIKGFLQVLKKSLQEKGMDKECGYTEIMLSELSRINGLVSEFLLLSKPRDSVFYKLNLSDVLVDILPIINSEGILHNVVVKYLSEEEPLYIVADRELLKQVCLNICKNAIEAMGDDGGVLQINEVLDRDAGLVSLEISDTGAGIPSFVIDKIFDPFFTTKSEGVGLGLSVCQRIIHDMGGTIRVKSKGFGTTFTISIPSVGR